ncbi:MAG: hypothetical protein JXR69_05410 [Candidatus Delongbacteria bacterium]|nr:hypothetical protein [Candidatus Delongbacteria bacterium]
MKYATLVLLMLISFTYISCDSDYSGETSDTFKIYYAVEADSLSLYSLEFYVNSTYGTLSIDSLTDKYISDSLVMNVTEADSFYMKLTNFQDDTLSMMVLKGISVFRSLTVTDTGKFIIEGKFDQ